ncbi:hypothetical protein FRC10_000548 [Ceratobasidium sp. 414]|nr:hypothetical protein FRC10_000548 [Ceratobasidium sp. 414]
MPCVFERDLSVDHRPQGGTLDLHTQSGQQAIRDAGLWDEFRKHARYDGQESKLLTKSGKVLLHNQAMKSIVMCFGKYPTVVRWNHALVSIQPGDGQTFDLHFKDGKVESGFGLVVGADGTWSRVRPLLTDVVPFYSGACYIEANITHPDGPTYDTINKLVGRGSVCGCGDEKAIAGQRLGDNSIRVFAMFSIPHDDPNWAQRHFGDLDSSKARAELIGHFDQDWDAELRELIKLSDGEVVPRPLYMFPIGHKWEGRPGLTLIGDVGHVMTPFSDSLELSKAIVVGAAEGSLHEKVREFELGMFGRMEDAAKRAEQGKSVMLSIDIESALQEVLRAMASETAKPVSTS